jgi:glycyl-tRNA synthetase
MKKDGLSEKAKEIYNALLKENKRYQIFYDEAGSIGKRYARLDEIGCNYCLTIDHETLEKQTVTIRDRDSQEQKRIPIKSLSKILDKLYFQEKKFSKL